VSVFSLGILKTGVAGKGINKVGVKWVDFRVIKVITAGIKRM